MLKSGQTWAGIFATYDSDGSLKAPSSGPTGTLYVDGSSNSATVTITGSNPYKFSVTLPTLTAGQRVDMYITATISGIATAGIVASDQADTAYISNVKSDTADILADTGTDGVLLSVGTGSKQIDLSSGKVLLQPTQTGVTIPTVTNLTNLPTMPTDWITADGVKADAVTKIQSGLATAIELTNVQNLIKYPPILVSGAGTLAANGKYYFDSMLNGYPKYKHDSPLPNIFIYYDADAWHINYQQLDDYYSCSDYANTPDATIAAWEKGPQGSDPIPTVSAYLDPDDPTLGAIMEAIEDISTGLGATPQQIWEYETRTLTDASNLGLATATALATVSAYVDDLESRLTAARAGYLDKLNVTGTLANTDNANNFKADVSNLALEATLTAIKGSGWTNETLKAIKEYVDDLESRLTAVRAGYLDNLTKLDANVSSRLAASGYTAPDNANILNIKAKTDNLPATPADEATLTAMKGTGWTGIETLKAIKDYVDELETRLTAARAGYLDKLNVSGDLANTNNADAFKADVSDLALQATLEAIMGTGWTDETLVALMLAIEAISTGLGATPQQIWEYVSRTLTDASDLGLATSEELAEAVADIQGGQGDTLETMTYKINTIDNVVDTIYAEMGSAPEIADAVLDELLDDHTIDGSLGDTVADIAAKTNNLPDNPALDEVLIDTGTQQFTTADLIKIIAAKMVGKASGGGTTSIVYRNLEDSVDIIVETVDENGNRSDITLAP